MDSRRSSTTDILATTSTTSSDDSQEITLTLNLTEADLMDDTKLPRGGYLLRPSTRHAGVVTLSYKQLLTGEVNHIRFACNPENPDDKNYLNWSWHSAQAISKTVILRDFIKKLESPAGKAGELSMIKIISELRQEALLKREALKKGSSFLVISTSSSPLMGTGAAGFFAGGTADKMALIGAGIVKAHRNKIIAPEEMSIYENCLRPNGWLVITGHGQDGANLLAGAYRVPQAETAQTGVMNVDLELSAHDYTQLVLQSGRIKNGDHLNVLLNVCCAGVRKDDRASFAEQLALAFAESGITTTIVASTMSVGRINSFNEQEGDIPGKQFRFRTEPQAIRIFETTRTENDTVDTSALNTPKEPNKDFLLTTTRLGFSTEEKPEEKKPPEPDVPQSGLLP